MGAVLTQMLPEGERVMEYVSRQLTEGQQRWPTVEHEVYAIIFSIGKLRHYLVRYKFTIYADHMPLRSLFTADMRNPRVQRWAIKYTPGKNNVSGIRAEPCDIDAEICVIDRSVSIAKEKLQVNLE